MPPRHPKAPPKKKRGSRINFTESRLGSKTHRDLSIVLCPMCQKNGELKVWSNGDNFITHRGVIKTYFNRPSQTQIEEFSMTEFCYVGKQELKTKPKRRKRVKV